MKNTAYILLSFLLVFAGCRKVDKVETYQVEVGETTVTAGTDNVDIEAAYTYDYTLKSARLQYSDDESLDGAVSLAAQFDNGVLKATATGLKPATAYFYRFELDNGMTKMWTETGTFRTLDEPIVTELVVTTAEVSSIADTYAVCGGEVVSEGGSKVIARGVCYGLSENPSLDDCTGKTVDGGGLGAFTSVMTGLEKETKYYVRAYATDDDTTCYGEQKVFTTLGQIVYALPTVITNDVDETTVGQYTAMLSGVVTDDGNKPVTGCGFWYSTGHDTLGGITKPAAYSTGGFSLNVSDGIEPGTTYYARAYAENEIGRRLGNEVSFTTLSIPPTPDPQVFTLSSADVTTNSATIKGRVYYDGTENPIKKGFLYGTDVNDMNSDVDCTSQTDPFEAALTGLIPNTTYYYEAYATYTGYAQTFYGGIESFTTLVEITEPTIHTVGPSNITTTTANSGGYGITDGNSPIIKKGVCWAKSDNPTIDDCLGHTEDGTGTADFTSEVTGLEPDEDYYVRAYAVNQTGKTGYGEALGLHTMIMHQAPDVTTNQASGITGSSATVSGNVTNSYGCDITECWIIWGDSDNTMTNRLDCTAGTAFSGTLTGLANEHTYSFQAFAKNEYDETGNGGIEHFTTNNETPDVETLDATAITTNSATMNGRVNDDHGIGITECWFMWGTNADALTERADCTPGMTFSCGVDGLQPNTNYYFVAYAKNNNGLVGNGTVNQLLTSPTLPTVTTAEVTDIAQTTATGGGNVTSDGGATVTARGICWSTSPNPTISDSHTSNGTGTGTFTSSMTGLTPSTTYYVRAYATNSAGTTYGNPETFTTAQQILIPTVITSEITDITPTTATGGGNVTNDGGATVTARGICWSTSQNPTVSNSHTTDGTGTGTFTSSMTGLTPNTTYYVRAYATNSAGTAYGEQNSFTTQQNITLPTVTTNNVSNIAQTTATGGGNVTGDGGAAVTARGICWSTSQNPTVSNSHTTDGTGTGTFTSSMTGLTANTTYYVRAYATNSAGTAYGEQKSFTTQQNITLPTVTTNNVSNITPTTATGGGNVTSDGGATVTARGVCWSTSPNPTVNNSHTTNGSGTGSFTSSITGLTPNTTYYVRAYATNSAGTAYGEPKTFTTTQEETGNYFCITALDAGTTTVSMAKEGDAPTVYLEYKKNNESWTTFTVGSTNISLSQNDTVFFKAPNGQPNNKLGSDYSKYNHFVIGGGNVGVSGNIMYLLDPTGNKITLTSANSYAFAHLFNGCDKLASTGQLLMPATTLAESCYRDMFKGCTSLTTTPDLPATTLAKMCYAGMFLNCTSLTTASDLPATTLAIYCYDEMFYGCTSLTTAPDLPATTLANWCYFDMFDGCTSLTTAPNLPATTLMPHCYSVMFCGCTSLTTAPDLPATTLADWCYSSMFSGCTSLTTAPDLPATTLADDCYYLMFKGCTSLTTAPDLPATTLAYRCYEYMFFHCTSLTTAPDLLATTLADYCYYNMFCGCTSLTTAPDLPATTLAADCYSSMFSGCTSLTTAPDLPATTLAQNCYNNMFYGCTSLTTAPDLPATTLADWCYYRMFEGCSNLHYIRMLATENLNATTGALYEWVSGVPSTGDFYKKAGANLPSGINGIPNGWTVHNE